MTVSSEPLSLAALRLRNADPKAWADFISAMEVWSATRLNAMASAPPDGVFMAQGMALDARALLRIFNECHLERKPKPGAS